MKKLIFIFTGLICAWIAFCTLWGIEICNKEEKKAPIITVPIRAAFNGVDTVLYLPHKEVVDSMVVFDSLGIKIVGVKTK